MALIIVFFISFIFNFVIAILFAIRIIKFVGPYKSLQLVLLDSENKKIEKLEFYGDYEVAFNKNDIMIIRVPYVKDSFEQDKDFWRDIIQFFNKKGIYAIAVDERVQFFKFKKC